jgi:hypothetical protein
MTRDSGWRSPLPPPKARRTAGVPRGFAPALHRYRRDEEAHLRPSLPHICAEFNVPLVRPRSHTLRETEHCMRPTRRAAGARWVASSPHLRVGGRIASARGAARLRPSLD